MMDSNFSTSLESALSKIVDRMLPSIAEEGLLALRKVLQDSGFVQSEHLKGYQVFAHVMSKEIVFEILVPAESIEQTPELADKIEGQQEEKAQDMERLAMETYGLHEGRVVKFHDARRDARKPAQSALKEVPDKRRNSEDRKIIREIILHSPRSMLLNRQGKLSLSFKRSIRESNGEVHFPQGKFEGVVKHFLEELRSIVLTSFAPEMQNIINRYIA